MTTKRLNREERNPTTVNESIRKLQELDAAISTGGRTLMGSTLTPTNDTFIVGTGTDWATESASSARTSLGLGTAALEAFTEASWTPAIAFGGNAVSVTYTTQVGRSIRIGDLSVLWGSIVLSSNGSSTGDVTITGLPVAASTVAGLVQSGTVGFALNIDGAGNGLAISVASAASVIDVWKHEGDTTDDYIALTQTAAEVSDTAAIHFTLIYRTGT
jgi:hypothetical protein